MLEVQTVNSPSVKQVKQRKQRGRWPERVAKTVVALGISCLVLWGIITIGIESSKRHDIVWKTERREATAPVVFDVLEHARLSKEELTKRWVAEPKCKKKGKSEHCKWDQAEVNFVDGRIEEFTLRSPSFVFGELLVEQLGLKMRKPTERSETKIVWTKHEQVASVEVSAKDGTVEQVMVRLAQPEQKQPTASATIKPKVSQQPGKKVQQSKPRSSCCKVCRGSKPCGNSCISWGKTCRKGPGCAC